MDEQLFYNAKNNLQDELRKNWKRVKEMEEETKNQTTVHCGQYYAKKNAYHL